ncbi:MAG TPA: hypothetical protein VEZ71_24725 [Archangium sp.]|nr:hypothetical protein [Archangium sp.]
MHSSARASSPVHRLHTVDEFIEVDTLIPKAQALARYLASLAG